MLKKEDSSDSLSYTTNLPASTQNCSKPIAQKKQLLKKKTRNNLKKNGNGRNSTAESYNGSSASTGPGRRSTRNSTGGKDATNKRNEANSEETGKQTSNKGGSNGNVPGDEPTIGHIKRDEEDHHAVSVIVSLDDSFTLRQDMCLNCGSFGNKEATACDTTNANDNRLLGCSQCGQCYHAYCVGVNVCSVMLEKGWRCLDCTVCEGCGKATDESRLLLCDDCDISYHIYCLTPPLAKVPTGSWRCHWCVKCVRCGSKSPGGDMCEWQNNYTECAICFSLSECHVCEVAYKENDLVVKCAHCDRWSHVSCKHTLGEDEANKLIKQQGFSCVRCQKDKENAFRSDLDNKTQSDLLEEILMLSKRCINDEGVYLTESGSELMKRIKIKPAPVRRARMTKSTIRSNLDADGM